MNIQGFSGGSFSYEKKGTNANVSAITSAVKEATNAAVQSIKTQFSNPKESTVEVVDLESQVHSDNGALSQAAEAQRNALQSAADAVLGACVSIGEGFQTVFSKIREALTGKTEVVKPTLDISDIANIPIYGTPIYTGGSNSWVDEDGIIHAPGSKSDGMHIQTFNPAISPLLDTNSNQNSSGAANVVEGVVSNAAEAAKAAAEAIANSVKNTNVE